MEQRPAILPRLAFDESGATAVVIAICMTALMGFAGMAVDLGLWYADKRVAQGAADSAAYSAAIDYAAGDSASGVTANAKAVTAQYGLTDGAGGVTVTVNNPPTSGTHQTTGAVEVIVAKSETLFFSSFFIQSATVKARGVAQSGSSGGLYCVLATKTAAATSVSTADIDISNGATVDVTQCGVAVNATGPDALYVSGGAKLNAKTVSVSGNYVVNNGAQMNVSGTTTINAPTVADPYAGVSLPTATGACDHNNASYGNGGTYTINPGTYCNGLSIANGARVTLSAGVYVIDRGAFVLAGGSTVTATAGVTIVLTSSTSSNYATSEIDNGTTFSITAPTTGATKGLALVADRNAPSNTSLTFAGGSTSVVTGAMYFPSVSVSISNGSTNAASCTQLIAYEVDYSGGSKFGNSCSGVGTTGIGSTSTSLVE